MKKIIVFSFMVAAAAVPFTASAQTDPAECYVGDYQGVPIDVCPTPEPDPTNCYWGDYQGAAPIEICMPTGWGPDPSWTYQGEPIVMHDSTVIMEDDPRWDCATMGNKICGTVATGQPPVPTTTVPVVSWLDQLQAQLVTNGGW